MKGLTLQDRVVMVTGGARGIGAAIAGDVGGLGAAVAVCDRNVAQAEKVASELPGSRAYGVDLTLPGEIEAMADRILADLGRVDVLVSCAGWDKVGLFVQSEPGIWDQLLGLNLRAPIQLTHRFLPGMLERGWGRLVFISSDAARVGSTGEAVYAASKAGLMGFSKTIAREGSCKSVTSNVVCPGPTDTALLAEVTQGNEKLFESMKRGVPMGRVGSPEDVSGLVAFICSERAAYITGQTISVSGGLTMA